VCPALERAAEPCIDRGWVVLPSRYQRRKVIRQRGVSAADENTHRCRVHNAVVDDNSFPARRRAFGGLRLPSPHREFDVGIRIKGGLVEHLCHTAPDHGTTAAVRRLIEAAHATAHVVASASGDLVLLDNDRWGHGRQTVVGTAVIDDVSVANPRELWSDTIG
jgi:hypothetical protein